MWKMLKMGVSSEGLLLIPSDIEIRTSPTSNEDNSADQFPRAGRPNSP